MMATAFVITWSSGFVGASLVGDSAGPAPMLAWRYLITAMILLVAWSVQRVRGKLHTPTPHEVAQQAALGLLAHAVFLGGVFGAASCGVDAGLSALVCALQPLVVAVAGQVAFGDRLRGVQWAGLALGLAGVGVSIGRVRPAELTGVALVVTSLAGLSAASLLERAWRPRTGLLTSLLIQVATGATVFTAYAAVTGGLAASANARLVLALAWLVLLSGLGGYATFTWCLRHLGVTTTSALLYLTPAVTTLWAWVAFAQRPGVRECAGLGIVLVGVLLAISRRGGAGRGRTPPRVGPACDP